MSTLATATVPNFEAMANLSTDLKSYLSGKSGTNKVEDSSSASYTPLTSWFSKGSDQTAEGSLDQDANTTSNGWFNNAQKDPCCPALVSLLKRKATRTLQS